MSHEPDGADSRSMQIGRALVDVEERIAAACSASGRAPEDVTLIAVTKTFPASDIRLLAGLGVTHVGENKVQEATTKAAEGAFEGLTLHFVGRLQSNKAGAAGALADVVHTVDRASLVSALAAGRHRSGRPGPLPVLIQVSLDGDTGRGGALPHTVPELIEVIGGHTGLRLAGVMAVPPIEADPAAAFEQLQLVSQQVRSAVPAASIVSAGMSQDLEAAVAAGATHLRVGSAILGSRAPLR